MTILSKQITAVSHILITGIFIVCITKKTNQNTRKPNHNTTQWGKKKKPVKQAEICLDCGWNSLPHHL